MKNNRSTFLAAIVLIVLCILIALPKPAKANGAYGHLYVGEKAIQQLSNHDLKNFFLHTKKEKGKNTILIAFRNGLGFPDAAMDIGSDAAHNAEFYNSYIKDLAWCKKESGTWWGKSRIEKKKNWHCAKRLAHFMGALAHVVTDALHDKGFMREVEDRCNLSMERGGVLSCDGTEGLLGCKDRESEGDLGAQHYTDVLIDYHLADGLKALAAPRPSRWYVPSSILPKHTYKRMKVSVSSKTLSNKVKEYYRTIMEDEPYGLAGNGGDKAAQFCSWGVKNFLTYEEGGIDDAAEQVAKILVQTWDIMAQGHYPVIRKSGTWSVDEKWTVTKGSKVK